MKEKGAADVYIDAEKVFSAINQQTNAGWWIQNQDYLTSSRFRTAYNSVGRDLGVELLSRQQRRELRSQRKES